MEKYVDKSVKIGGDSKGNIFTGDNITITNSFNEIKDTIEKDYDYSSDELKEIFEKLNELENELKKEVKDISVIDKIKDFFKNNYEKILPLILPIIQAVI